MNLYSFYYNKLKNQFILETSLRNFLFVIKIIRYNINFALINKTENENSLIF